MKGLYGSLCVLLLFCLLSSCSSLLVSDFESGNLEPWQDDSLGFVNWIVEDFNSPLDPSSAPQPQNGTHYLRAYRSSTGFEGGLAVLNSPEVSVNPGDKFRLAFWIRSRYEGENTLQIYWLNGNREQLLLDLSPFSTGSNYQWQRGEVAIPATETTTTKFIIYGYCGSYPEDAIAVDDIVVGA